MIGRRGFFKAIGAAVLGMSLALKAPEAKWTSEREVKGFTWEVSSDGGVTWRREPYGRWARIESGDIIKFEPSRSAPIQA